MEVGLEDEKAIIKLLIAIAKFKRELKVAWKISKISLLSSGNLLLRKRIYA